ncbi:hypothetical protein OE88DRAFT_1663440 [Heliocybe sulcata]|uniref:Uncharacterized protein n=1 Tax=Heliocybe sulcata TaxID=5364 RepID=A0A5C3MW35_9AGAM|nr:hypothetical protein OE88DRAFT_1663440 [Heliocybe sulcata]
MAVKTPKRPLPPEATWLGPVLLHGLSSCPDCGGPVYKRSGQGDGDGLLEAPRGPMLFNLQLS